MTLATLFEDAPGFVTRVATETSVGKRVLDEENTTAVVAVVARVLEALELNVNVELELELDVNVELELKLEDDVAVTVLLLVDSVDIVEALVLVNVEVLVAVVCATCIPTIASVAYLSPDPLRSEDAVCSTRRKALPATRPPGTGTATSTALRPLSRTATLVMKLIQPCRRVAYRQTWSRPGWT